MNTKSETFVCNIIDNNKKKIIGLIKINDILLIDFSKFKNNILKKIDKSCLRVNDVQDLIINEAESICISYFNDHSIINPIEICKISGWDFARVSLGENVYQLKLNKEFTLSIS